MHHNPSNKFLSTNQQILRIISSIRTDAGEYVCEAKNRLGVVKRVFNIEIYGMSSSSCSKNNSFKINSKHKSLQSAYIFHPGPNGVVVLHPAGLAQELDDDTALIKMVRLQ